MRKGVLALKKLHARFVSFLLSLIMVFSMIPAPAHAIVGGNYGMSGSGDIPPGKAVGDWKASYGTNTFLRFTLVEFPDGVLDGNITNYRVVGHSVNIYHLGTDEEDPRRTHIEDFINNSSDSASYVKWYDSNAMTYLKGGAEAIKQTPIYDGAWGHANEYVLSYSEMADKYHLTHEEIEDMMWVEGPKWGGAHWENADFTSFFGGDVSYIGALRNYKAKPMLGQVIKLLEPEKTDPSWSGLSIEQTGDKFSSGTTDSGKGTRYRLLIEPGQFLHLSAIDKEEAWYALTVRDMAAYNKVFENGSTSKGSIPHDINSLLLKRGINMAQAATQFVEYDVGSDGRPIDGTQKISTGGFTAADMTIVNDASTGGTNKAVYMINKTLGSEHMAYGLGIISPMNFVRSSGLTVMKKLAGVTDPAVKDKLWEFTLTYSKTGTGGQKLTTPKSFTVKAGNTDITNDTSRVTKNGNDGFTFKAKADEIIAISFEYNQSEGDVYYRVAETDPAAESYTKTMLLNDKDVSMNDSGVPTDGIYGNTSEANTKCVFVNSAGLTVSKKAVGAGMADKEFAFLAVFTDSEGNVLPNGSKGTMTKNGVSQEFDFGQWNGANFFLKNGESVSFQVPGTWRYRITENEAGVGYATKANGKDLTAAEPWVDGTVSNEPSVEFVNTKADGNAHLIIDYNFNGANATTGEGSSDDHTASSATADCGAHAVGDAVTIAPKLNGAALTEGQTIPIPGLNGTCAECGGAYSAMMTFKGIYTAPTGGTKVGSTYTIDHEGLTILYAQWAPSLSMNCNHTVTTPGGPGTGTTGDLYTVFWDYNYTSSAVTSSVCGEFEIWYRLDNCEITFDESGMIDEHTDSYSRVKVTYGFSVPNSNGSGDAPYRQGYTFLGWDTDREKFKNTQGSTLPAPTAPGKSTTYYAIWRANSITWNANGGLFDFADDPSQFDTTTYELQDGGRKVKWLPIVLPATTQAPIVKYVPHRTGYTFAGWFFDANCTVPITESDWGIEPDRTYYAGWNAEKVVVNYYDVRQGTAPIMSQTFDYDDAFSLLSYMNDSDGWTFTGWKLAQLDGGMMPAKPVATTTGAPGTGTILNERLGTAVINYHQGDKDHTGSWNDPNSDPALTAEGYWEIDLVASWNEETTSYTTTIVWNDYQNNDGARPKSVEVGLISSITRAEVASENVTGNMTADNWSVTFPNLSITNNDASVEKVTYIPYLKSYTSADGTKHAIQDTTATNGEILTAPVSHADTTAAARYTYAINNINMGDWNMGYDGTIYFNHDLITTGDDLKFTIQWEDERNNDGFRPSAVTLTLFANGIPVKNFTGSGAHLSQTGVVSVNPGMCDISMNGSAWTYTFKDYQKYDKGAPIDYSVVISDYNQVKHDAYSPEELQYLDPADIGGRAGVILTHAIERSNCPVIVEWDDENNRDGIRPGAVTVTLTAYEWNADTYRWEETLVGTKLVMGSSTAENWNTEFENVKVYNGGQKIIYKASVSSDLNAHIPAGSNGYSWIGNETRVTISHNKDVKDVPVIIHWDDHNNNDAIRPVSAVVQLWADGVRVPGAAHAATVSGSDKDDVWAYTFKDMPIYRDGKSGEEIVYTITVEESVKDSIYGTYITTANGEQQRLTRYTATYMYTDAEGETVTTDDAALSDRAWVRLTHAIDQGTIDVYASWHDEQNRDNKRPASLQVELYKQVDGVREYMRTLTLVAGRDNSWSSKITGLPLYEGGKPVTYLVDISEDFRGELESTYGYTVSTQDNVVHLYYTPQTGTVSTKLYWADNDDNDNIRPDTVKATLYVNGVATSMTLDLNAENDWSATWTDLDTYFGDRNGLGQLTVYSVKVEDVDGYTVTYTPESVTTEDNQVIFINMNHGANVSNIPVRIYWNDDRNMDNLRPENVTVQLYADGEPVVGKTLVMTGDSLSEVWSGVFENMPTHNNGNEIFYTVQAADTIGRTFEVMTAGTSLYLSHDAQKGDLYVSFRFDDSNNADGYRPEGGYLQLQVVDADGNEEDVIGANGVHTIYFDADGRVNDYFRGLPINKTSGSALKYTVKVEWDDDQFGGRGEKYEVKYSRPIALSTVSQNQLVITAAEKNETGLGVELGTETGVVYWFDNNNQRGNRPPELMINVYNDVTSNVEIFKIKKDTETSGTVYDEAGNVRGTAEIDKWGQGKAATQWRYSIDKLPQRSVYENGQSRSIYYWATARDTGLVPWYTTTDGQRNGLDVLLTHVNYLEDFGSSTKDFDVHINWMDNQDAWGYRPDTLGVDVELYANEDKTPYKTVHMTMANAPEENENTWTYRFKDLPTYLNGSAVVWKVKINDLPWYTETVSNYADYSVIKMTQSIGFDFRINWKDEDNDDAVRPEPEDMVLMVYGDGKYVGDVKFFQISAIAPGSSSSKPYGPNIMTASIQDLPVWRETDTTVPVQYTFQWHSSPMTNPVGTAEYLSYNGYSASASMNGEKIEGAANWYWLSAELFGDKADAGLNDEGMYQWETTLTRSRDVIDVSASVNWDDDANRDGFRPENVMLQLFADGEPFGEPVEVSEETEWTYIWKDLPLNEKGTQIEYTVDVVPETIPSEYSSENTDATHITLFHEPEQITLLSRINWMDNTELHFIRNSVGDLVTTLAQIKRVPVYAQLLANGEP